MTGTSHLTLEEMTEHAAGAPADVVTEAHLATCAACRAEVNRWSTVAAGVRHVMASTPPPPSLVNRLPERRRGRLGVVLGAAAAATVLVGATVAGINALSGGGNGPVASPPVASASLTPTTCPDLKLATGTLETVSGTGFVLRTATGPVTVRTSDGTNFTRTVTTDIATAPLPDGVPVIVQGSGTEQGDEITADHVTVLPESAHLPKGMVDTGRILARAGTAIGTVTGVHDGGFAVQTSDGTRIRIITRPTTTTTRLASAPHTDLAKDQFTVAVGIPQTDGTLRAAAVQQNSGTGNVVISVQSPASDPGCDPVAIASGALFGAK
jgi:hypothetical protein